MASSPPSSSFSGLRIQDKHGAKLADVRVEVSRKGVRLEGKKGVLGNFPFQSILSWTRCKVEFGTFCVFFLFLQSKYVCLTCRACVRDSVSRLLLTLT
jgi:hypothetical protein